MVSEGKSITAEEVPQLTAGKWPITFPSTHRYGEAVSLKACHSDRLPPTRPAPHQSAITSRNKITNWRPRVQTAEPMRYISHPNHLTKIILCPLQTSTSFQQAPLQQNLEFLPPKVAASCRRKTNEVMRKVTLDPFHHPSSRT